MVAGIACGPAPGAGLDLRVRFASRGQAETGAGGLPLGVRSYLIQARAGGSQGALLGGTGCIDVDDDDPRRFSVKLDVAPATDAVLLVSGYDVQGCAASPAWQGMAAGVEVVEGETTRVAVYVTRRGLRVNDSRASFPRPRAFASATPLPDGRVLVAGGFELASPAGGGARLVAACDAGIYHPGTATFEKFVSLPGGCRGFHRALSLADGRVLLVGGTRVATVRVDGGLAILPDWQNAVLSADLFDPATDEFNQVDQAEILGRADAAAVVLPQDGVMLMGGRTETGRTADVVIGRSTGNSTWDWSLVAQGLNEPRAGGRAVSLDAGVLLVGGAAWGGELAGDLLDPATGMSTAGLPGQPLLGQSLTRLGGTTAMAAGGVGDYPGARPVDVALGIEISGAAPIVTEQAMAGARAYHAAGLLPDGSILLAGGIDERGEGRSDLEVVAPAGGSRMLEDTAGTGAVGAAAARLPDGSVLLAGGMDIQGDQVVLSGTVQIVSP